MIEKHELTKDTYKDLCLIYKAYLEKRKSGISKEQSMYFEDNDDSLEITGSYDDFYSSLCELKSNQLIKLYVDGGFQLTPSAISLMENRFKKGISEVIDFILDIVPDFIP
mgnify:CR=1 FL=1